MELKSTQKLFRFLDEMGIFVKIQEEKTENWDAHQSICMLLRLSALLSI